MSRDDGGIPRGFPEQRAEPRDEETGWEIPAFACGCGRSCVSWADHWLRVAAWPDGMISYDNREER